MNNIYDDYFNQPELLIDDIKNEICLVSDNTAAIKVVRSNGDTCFILIDAYDAVRCSQHRWNVRQNGNVWYAYTQIRDQSGKYNTVAIHKFIMYNNPLEPASDRMIDHINRNGLDNRRCNLRYCTNQQNQWNTKIPSSNQSGTKGVSYTAHLERYLAQIRTPDGRDLWKSFSCKKYGHDQAKEMAIQQRVLWEQEYQSFNSI